MEKDEGEADAALRKPSITAATLKNIPIDRARESMKDNIFFQIYIVAAFSVGLAEAITVGFGVKDSAPRNAQIVFLALGTFLQLLELHLVAPAAFDAKDQILREVAEGKKISKEDEEETNEFDFWGLFDGEVIFNIVCLVFGWCTFFEAPGLSALRAFRVFRYVWIAELFIVKKSEHPEKELFNPIHATQLCLLYVEKIGAELFTGASKGAVVVLALFFYVTYLFAVVFWIAKHELTTPEGNTCGTLNDCFITMMRLALYDGTGLDYMQTMLTEGAHGYVFILIIYMIITAMILLNGLIGIFGDAFSSANDNDDDDEDKKDDVSQQISDLSIQIASLQDMVTTLTEEVRRRP